MKTSLKYLLSVIVPVALMGCGSTETGTSAPTPQTSAASGSSDETPQVRIGMTKSQVLRAWGEPSGKDITGHGEIWVWGGQNWKRQIPYAGPFMKVQTSKVLFGPDGLVKDFRLTDKGDVMSEAEGHSTGFNPW
ncbi:MAG: hypothetical protein WC003_13370 [Terrimicrobiaceae bacterium]